MQMLARPTSRLAMGTASYTDREACSQVAQPWRPQDAVGAFILSGERL